MKRKRLASLALAAIMTASTVLAGCGQGKDTNSAGRRKFRTGSGRICSRKQRRYGGCTGAAPVVSHDTEMTIEIYDKAANYQGIQAGWFGKVLKGQIQYPA